ncbi:hypothetical protein ACTFIW_007997 [Dictyostelium discoideum]
MNKVKKTGINIFIDKKKTKKEIVSDESQLEKGMALKSLLVRYTRNHIEECEKLEKDIGSVQALSTTITGMKNIELLKVSSSPIAQKTSKACNTLVKLVNYSGNFCTNITSVQISLEKQKWIELKEKKCHLPVGNTEPEVSDFPLGKTYNTIVLSKEHWMISSVQSIGIFLTTTNDSDNFLHFLSRFIVKDILCDGDALIMVVSM